MEITGRQLILAMVVMLASGCATSTPDNPYPGRGGSQLRYPTRDEVADARLTFDPAKLATLRVGASTRRDVETLFGKPTWWETNAAGYSQIGYDFHGRGATVNLPGLSPATFVFDANNVLVDAVYANSYKTVRVERGPYTYAYVEGRVRQRGNFSTASFRLTGPEAFQSVGMYVRR